MFENETLDFFIVFFYVLFLHFTYIIIAWWHGYSIRTVYAQEYKVKINVLFLLPSFTVRDIGTFETECNQFQWEINKKNLKINTTHKNAIIWKLSVSVFQRTMIYNDEATHTITYRVLSKVWYSNLVVWGRKTIKPHTSKLNIKLFNILI